MGNIIDDLLQNITKEVGKVQARSQEMLQSYNLNGQVRELERKKTAKLLEIGRLICDKYQKDLNVSEDLLKDKVNEITGYEQEIVVLQSELDSMKMQHDPNVSSTQKAEAKAGYTPTPGYECPRCHAPANKEKSFCPLCGETLKRGSEEEIVDVEPNGGTR